MLNFYFDITFIFFFFFAQVHLDLKPENVLYVGEEGTPEGESVKICDFGISRTLDSERKLYQKFVSNNINDIPVLI